MASTRSTVRSLGVAVRLTLLSTVVLGVAFPLAVWGVGQGVFPAQANGSLVRDASGAVVGSSIVGQSSGGPSGSPDAAASARWFWSRPSSAGEHGYDANASSPSNLGPSNPALRKTIDERRRAVAAADGVPTSAVPADAVTGSGSGLDPDISPEYARQQVSRVADARGLSVARVRALVAEHTEGRQLGFLGAPRVDVLALNLALARLS